MGETRVDLQHLLEDIRDAYPGSLEESIVTEIVANSLDSGAGVLRFRTDPVPATLTVVDDGSGMSRRELARYHDIAASTKSRGEGIGFAGVGIKLGILASEDVLTETARGKSRVATLWRLASRHKAPWRWVPPSGLVDAHGTAVRLRLRNPLSPLLDAGFLESVLRRHFAPLLDPGFDEILAPHYPLGLRLLVNDAPLERRASAGERVTLAVRLGRRRKPTAVGYLARFAQALPEDEQGMAVSTLGKVIKRGWDWLGLTPSDPARIVGLIEVPGLAESLTLNKADFIRSGPRGALYLACRKGIQEAASGPLAAWGAAGDERAEESRRRKIRPLERDLVDILLGVADDFPLVSSLIERRAGGQKRLSLASGREGGAGPQGITAGRLSALAPGEERLEPAEPPSAGAGAPEALPTPSPGAGAEAGGDVTWPDGRRR
ncbi:MAG TPA: ATP-binding protein, partial [Methylomirabilota bacterium]